MDMEKSLAELFVLAACGKLAALKGGDDLGSLVSFGGLDAGAKRLHSLGENRPAFVQSENPLVEQDVKNGRGNGPAS
jgi:hypothetical protein